MYILIIKLSSMGDVIHTLPALTEAKRAIPDLKIDWLIEASFQEIPVWHSAVDKIIPINLRQWRKKIFNFSTIKAIISSLKNLRAIKYDLIIDAQGLLKSAILGKLARTSNYIGFDSNTARENLASLFYTKKIAITEKMHAINKTRTLLAKALNYTIEINNPAGTSLDYGVNWSTISGDPVVHPKPYLIFLHGTTWQTKHWPDQYWLHLAQLAAKHGFDIHMTWATAEQKARVEYLSTTIPAVKMLPHLTLNAMVKELFQANAVVTVDTGFGHLAAAMGIHSVALYGPTDPQLVGTIGEKQINLHADLPCVPCSKRYCKFIVNHAPDEHPSCMLILNPLLVWDKLTRLRT